MKKTICIALLMVMIISAFAQQTDYLQKSKNQKTAGFILLGTGVTAFAIAAPGNVSFDILPVLVIGGGMATLGSIPLFIASGKNKRKAKAATSFLKMETTPVIQHASFVSRSYPALSVKIRL